MEVFISWSGNRSKALAYELSKWLRHVIHYIRPWMSDRELDKGDRWWQVIGNKLSECQIGIICVTPENLESPWLLFEAGAISKVLGESRVCPLLLGMHPSELNGPLSQFQATTFTKDDIFGLLETLNKGLGDNKLDPDVLQASFGKFWPDLEDKVKEISKIGIDISNLRIAIDSLQGYGFPHPEIGRVLHFKEGFESHLIYQTACSIAKKRLYIFGRKNRKIFDKNYWPFFKDLKERIKKSNFDFRCLFLDCKAPEHVISDAHEDPDFINQLISCHKHAISVLKKYGINPKSVFRSYKIQRDTAMIIADNTVMFAPIERNSDGKVKRLTKRSFEVVDTNIPLGKELLKKFLLTWDSAAPF